MDKKISPKGYLKVVGIGPGSREWMSERAIDEIKNAQVVCGYKTYIELLNGLISPHQKTVQTGMTQELERVEAAIRLALSGKRVVLVCSGDPGIYGLSGLVYEVLKRDGISKNELHVEVIPGMPALSACAGILGAPLVHDFSVISLSDLLTPWELIEKRIEGAAMADFVIVLYNPRSKKRKRHLPRALEIVSSFRSGDTPVGIVKKAMRAGQKEIVSILEKALKDNELVDEVDMQSLVIIGNSKSFIWEGKIITPRGYDI